MSSVVEKLPIDIFAWITSYNSNDELLQLRQLSRAIKRKIDSNALWQHRLHEYYGVTRAAPHPSRGGSEWRNFVLQHGLLRMPQNLGARFGHWSILAQGASDQSRSRVLDEGQAVVEAIRPPLPLHMASPTTSVGIILCLNSSEPSSSLESLWPIVEQQVLQFLHVSQVQPPDELLTSDGAASTNRWGPGGNVDSDPNSTLYVMNAFPFVGSPTANATSSHPHHVSNGAFRMVLCAVDKGTAHQRRAAAEHFATLMHTCSLVHLIGDSPTDIIQYAQGIAPVLPTVEAAAFSTNYNTPTLVLNTNPIVPSRSTTTAKKEEWFGGADVATVLQQCPASFQTWVLNRTCSVGTALLSHRNLFSVMRTPFAVPSFTSPGVTAAIGPSTIVRMAWRYLSDRTSDFPRSSSIWEEATVKHYVKGHVAFHATFYGRAMATDFEECTRPAQGAHFGFTEAQCEALAVYDQYRTLAPHVLQPQDRAPVIEPEEHQHIPTGAPTTAEPLVTRPRFHTTEVLAALTQQHLDTMRQFPEQRVPMDPLDMVETHNSHCYTALRKFAFALPSVAGPDTEKGLRQLEILKREIADLFRIHWRRNNEYSRVYCNTLFSFLIAAPLYSKFFADRFASRELASIDRDVEGVERYGIHDKRGLRNFFRAAKDMMEEYMLKARGLRQFDILSERLADSLIPSVLAFCTLHPHKHTPLHAVREACDELQKEVVKANAQYSQSVDGRLNEAQGESALYTASLSSEWAAEAERSAIQHMRAIVDEVEAWESACLARIRILLSSPAEDDGANSTASSSLAERDGRTEESNYYLTGSGSETATTNSNSMMGGRRNSSMADMDLLVESIAPMTSSSVGVASAFPSTSHNGGGGGPTREEMEEAEDAQRRIEYEGARQQLMQQAIVSEANFRTQSARLSSRLASSSQHSKSFSIVRSANATSRDAVPQSLAGRLKQSLRNFLN